MTDDLDPRHVFAALAADRNLCHLCGRVRTDDWHVSAKQAEAIHHVDTREEELTQALRRLATRCRMLYAGMSEEARPAFASLTLDIEHAEALLDGELA